MFEQTMLYLPVRHRLWEPTVPTSCNIILQLNTRHIHANQVTVKAFFKVSLLHALIFKLLHLNIFFL